jgi:hypothetical protein
MLYGFEIFHALRRANRFEVIEIYPYSIVSEFYRKIPYTTEQGIISAEQGILVQKQGIFPVKSEITR